MAKSVGRGTPPSGTNVRGTLVVFRSRVFSAIVSLLTSKRQIHDLCTRVCASSEGSEQFWAALRELRDAVEEHIARLRQKAFNRQKRKTAKSLV
jgi:hypothetical protein